MVEVKIEGQKYTLLLDSGASPQITLQKNALQKIRKKKQVGTLTTGDIRGNFYQSPRFIIPTIDLGPIQIQEAVAVEQSNDFTIQGSNLWPSEKISPRIRKILKHIDGKIGWKIFRDHHCFIDFPHSMIFISDNKNDLESEIGTLEGTTQIPFDLESYGAVISLKTDLGILRFLLDTGATRSVLNKSLVSRERSFEVEPEKWMFTSSQVSLDDKDFGRWDFALFDLSVHLEAIDGILGVDFFKKHRIYLDFQTQAASFP